MKIAILVWGFPPKRLAGAEIATYNIASHLARRGYKVHVITSLDEGLPKESVEQGFHVHRLGFPKVKFLGIAIFWLKILITLRKVNPDVVHAQGTGMGLTGFLAKMLFKKPYLVWRRGTDVRLVGLFVQPLSKLALKKADAVIALTEDMKREIQTILNREVFVIPNGIDFERFHNLSRDEMRYELQARADERLIVFVGRFRPEKGVRYLIEAMEIIRRKSQNVRLILVGEGPEEEDLKRLVGQLNLKDCINFLGQVPNEEVPQYMAASDVFVLPSLSEGFPNVILEAMASGLAIVASKVSGLPEIVEDGGNGFLVESRNPEQIAEKVLLLLGDDELRERISKNNKETAKGYSWESVVERLDNVYYEVIGK
jgi:N-acetyl-alpha-D-glucosaminyl L-malate synthase BshA